MRLQGKVAVVTGAGKGLGKGIAVEFTRQGAVVVAAERDAESGGRTLAEIRAIGGDGWAVTVDIADSEQVDRCFDGIVERFGKLDILVNNAGITGRSIGDGPVADCLEEAWDRIVGVNLKGTFLCCKQALRTMQQQRRGVIVNMSSVLGMVGCQDHFTSHAYQTSKAGIIGLTRSIAAYYAKYNIRANVLAPGLMASQSTAKVVEDDEIMAYVRRMQPLGELGEAEDAAHAAVYLASDESRFVTGQVLAVDGGWTVQ